MELSVEAAVASVSSVSSVSFSTTNTSSSSSCYTCFWLVDTNNTLFWLVEILQWRLPVRNESSLDRTSRYQTTTTAGVMRVTVSRMLCSISNTGKYSLLIGWLRTILISDWLFQISCPCHHIVCWCQLHLLHRLLLPLPLWWSHLHPLQCLQCCSFHFMWVKHLNTDFIINISASKLNLIFTIINHSLQELSATSHFNLQDFQIKGNYQRRRRRRTPSFIYILIFFSFCSIYWWSSSTTLCLDHGDGAAHWTQAVAGQDEPLSVH